MLACNWNETWRNSGQRSSSTHTHTPIRFHSRSHRARESARETDWERERARAEHRPFSSVYATALVWVSEWQRLRSILFVNRISCSSNLLTCTLSPKCRSPTRRTVCVGHACDRDGNACQEQSSANCGGNTQNEKFSSYRRHTATVKWSTLTLRLTVSRLGVSLLLRLINGNGNGNGGDERLSYWVMNFSCGSRGFCLVYFSAFPHSTIYFRRSHKILRFLQSEQFKTKNKTEADKQNL